MDGYSIISLKDMTEQLGEDSTRSVLSSFLCPLNKDVEYFLHKRAIEFAKQSIASTHIVMASYRSKLEIAGYFTLTIKSMAVYKDHINATLARKINKFGSFDVERRAYVIPAPLIAQLGKNYRDGLNLLIEGNELLKLAVDRVALTQQTLGGKVVYVECEDKLPLLSFYERNGFVPFGRRPLDNEEQDRVDGKELVQLLRVIKHT